MKDVVVVAAWIAAGLNAAAALWGAWCWWRLRDSRAFWVLTRAGQAAMVAFAVLTGLLALLGRGPDDDLFWVYVLVPLGISFAAEQFRVLSAETVLDAREVDGVEGMRKLPAAEQELIRTLIQRRETGVMALAAAANAFMLARAALTAGGFA